MNLMLVAQVRASMASEPRDRRGAGEAARERERGEFEGRSPSNKTSSPELKRCSRTIRSERVVLPQGVRPATIGARRTYRRRRGAHW
jgi:hypothetical protein